MQIRAIPASAYRRTRWKNGLGWTTELALHPAGAEFAQAGFEWRISIAEIDSDCDFSAFPGYDRSLMLIEGDGIELSGAGLATQTLRHRGLVARFSGESAPHCRVIGGPSRDFNVMTRRGAFHHSLMLRPVVDTMVLFSEPRVEWFVYVSHGALELRHDDRSTALKAGESALIGFAPAIQGRCVLRGAGELALVKLEAVA